MSSPSSPSSPWILYTAAGTCALAVHIALREAGADFQLQVLDFGRTEQRSPGYLAINPHARVPALQTPQGVLTETPALLLYVAQTHPQAQLAPLDDPFALARVQAFNNYLASTVHVAHAHKRRGARWTDDPAAMEALTRYVPTSVGALAAQLQRDLGAGPWVLGERFSIADIYLYVVAGWFDGDQVPLAGFPALAAHQARVHARPAVQAALADYAG